MNAIQCMLCSAQIPLLSLLNHIPKCYRETCIAQGVTPYCTCNTCEGKKTHSEERIEMTSPKKRAHADDDNISADVSNEKKAKADKSQPTVSTRALQDIVCVVCGKSKSPSACMIPTIHIGKYRQLKICIKQHLEEETCALICKIIDKELAIISEHGDTSRSVLTLGSESEDEIEITK